MFELPEDLKKICAGKIIEGKEPEANTADVNQNGQRGRRENTNNQEENLDKAARRAAKKRRQKERKREEKLKAEQEAKI